MRVEICGAIASGKTTLCSLIDKYLIRGIYEDFKSNPFWEAFYSNPDKYNFETEVTFLLQHYHQIKATEQSVKTFACDFSLYQDLAFARVGLKDYKLNIFEKVMQECFQDIMEPDLLIYIECDDLTLLRRIKNRGRREEAEINLEFMHLLNMNIRKIINERANKLKIVSINSAEINFASEEFEKKSIMKMIATEIEKIEEYKSFK